MTFWKSLKRLFFKERCHCKGTYSQCLASIEVGIHQGKAVESIIIPEGCTILERSTPCKKYIFGENTQDQ